jgi:hypothetical protein
MSLTLSIVDLPSGSYEGGEDEKLSVSNAATFGCKWREDVILSLKTNQCQEVIEEERGAKTYKQHLKALGFKGGSGSSSEGESSDSSHYDSAQEDASSVLGSADAEDSQAKESDDRDEPSASSSRYGTRGASKSGKKTVSIASDNVAGGGGASAELPSRGAGAGASASKKKKGKKKKQLTPLEDLEPFQILKVREVVETRMKEERKEISDKQKKGVAIIMSKIDGSILERIRADCISTGKSSESVISKPWSLFAAIMSIVESECTSKREKVRKLFNRVRQKDGERVNSYKVRLLSLRKSVELAEKRVMLDDDVKDKFLKGLRKEYQVHAL